MKASDIFRQYTWLAETIYRSGGITLKELNERWVRTTMSGGQPMLRQTFNEHRKAIENMFGISIRCQRGSNTYYIEDSELLKQGSFQSWMLDSLSINTLLMDSGSLRSRLLMEHIPAGKEHFQTILRAMKSGHKLRLTYRKFGAAQPDTLVVEPYAVKVFHQRWYLLAKNYKRDTPSVYALDRMEGLHETADRFDLPDGFRAEEYFRDCYGVLRPPKVKPQRIVIRAYYPYAHYLRTLPLHPSQQELSSAEGYVDFEFYLLPTFDFLQELLAQGKEVEVLKPASLRKEMHTMLLDVLGRYE